MYKSLLYLLIGLFFTHEAKCQSRDTVVTFFGRYADQVKKVSTLDSADFIRMIYPDSSGNLYNINEYYKNGKLKFIGKFDKQATIDYNSNVLFLDGPGISYYPNGKRKNISNYIKGRKVGLEYFFKSDGHMCYVEKWVEQPAPYYNIKLYWECYDSNGNMICENGNGKWLDYNDDWTHVLLNGQVKNGSLYGEWIGKTWTADSIKYSINFKGGKLLSGIGYNKSGVSYPFKFITNSANYQGKKLITFIEILNDRLKLPKDESGKKINIDSVNISFIIDEEGQLTNLKVIGNTDPSLKKALDIAAAECGKWVPSEFCGIPFKTKFLLPLKVNESYLNLDNNGNHSNDIYAKTIEIKGTVQDLNEKLGFLNEIN